MICDIESARVICRKKKAKQWVKDSVLFWQPLVDEQDIGCDWCDAAVRCWRCGYLRGCQQCHIVPKSLGGNDEPSNIIPLCADCHDEMPNVIDSSVVWEWIKNDHGDMHDTYWTFRAIAAAREQGMTDEEFAKFNAKKLYGLEGAYSLHFGQLTGRARLTTSTLAWVIRECCK